ncbi:hypothetical protein AB0H34_05050 [Saccharopolyspora shandongensis]|uniref:hypothetical protein n=1 Tax=Saccharopolyspora shandongensis TaxID=418495 RepID=UPI0033F68B2B
MSPDSDPIKWLVVVAALVQTAAAVSQVRQGQNAGRSTSPAAAVSLPLKLGLLSSVASVLWVAGFNYLYERSKFGDSFVYLIRDEFENATLLKIVLIIGELGTPVLGCAAVAALLKAIVVGRLDMSQTLVYFVALVASAASMFVAVGLIYSNSKSGIVWPPIVIGALTGWFQTDVGQLDTKSGSDTDHS